MEMLYLRGDFPSKNGELGSKMEKNGFFDFLRGKGLKNDEKKFFSQKSQN